MVNIFKKLFKGADAAVVQSKIVVHTSSMGTTGTEAYGGYSREEYLIDLTDTETRSRIFDKMRRGDPQIKMCLNAVKSPIKSALWEIEPYDQNDEESKKDAELCKYVLFEGMEKSWSDFLIEALTILDMGFAVFEVIDSVSLNHPEFGAVNGIKNLAFRSPKTLVRWNLDPDTQKLKSVSQIANGDIGKQIELPAEFLLVLTLDKEGSNYEGISALRCCYGPWLRKNNYLKWNAIGIEKFAVPTPLVTVPEGKESGEQFDNMIAALEAYSLHEKGYLTKPSGWEVDLNTNTYDPQKVEVSIDNEDKRIVKSFMANFLELGMNGFGSQALSFDLSDFFLGSTEHIANIIVNSINENIIPRIVQMNRGPKSGYPKLKVSGISDRAGLELSSVLKNYFDSKIVMPDDQLEAHIRKRYNLPDKSLEGQRDFAQQTNIGKADVALPPVGTDVDIQKSALNGAQVTALVDLVTKVAAGILPRAAAVEIATTAFQIDKATAERVIGEAGKSFKIDPNQDLSTPKLSDKVRSMFNG